MHTHSPTCMQLQRLQLSASVAVKRVTEAVSQAARSEFRATHTHTCTYIHTISCAGVLALY